MSLFQNKAFKFDFVRCVVQTQRAMYCDGNRITISFSYLFSGQIITYSGTFYFVKINLFFLKLSILKQEPLTPWIFPTWQQTEPLFFNWPPQIRTLGLEHFLTVDVFSDEMFKLTYLDWH